MTPQAWTSLGAAQRASAAMRPHPQGVLPEGNQYLLSPEDAAAAARSRAEGLGALARLPDDLILRVLSGGDDDDGAGPSALAALARCSRICRAFAYHEDLWKAAVLTRWGGDFAFVGGSWRATHAAATARERVGGGDRDDATDAGTTATADASRGREFPVPVPVPAHLLRRAVPAPRRRAPPPRSRLALARRHPPRGRLATLRRGFRPSIQIPERPRHLNRRVFAVARDGRPMEPRAHDGDARRDAIHRGRVPDVSLRLLAMLRRRRRRHQTLPL